MSTVDLDRLNSATQYPSIETYHELDPDTGGLLEIVTPFKGDVVLTEKVDGAGGRIILMPDGDWFIGSRQEILFARGDRIVNPDLRIVETLLPIAERILGLSEDAVHIQVFFFEVYGHMIGASHKHYTSKKQVGQRMFDLAFVPTDVLGMERDRIASWRQHGGQLWATEAVLNRCSEVEGLPLTPRLGVIAANALPTTIDATHEWLRTMVPQTLVALDDGAGMRGEGIVLRDRDRTTIAKARFQNYNRTLQLRTQERGGKNDRDQRISHR